MFDLSHIDKNLEESQILKEIEKKIIEILDKDPTDFFNFLYRFDLPEQKVLILLKDNKFKEISKLIWNRQLSKMKNWED